GTAGAGGESGLIRTTRLHHALLAARPAPNLHELARRELGGGIDGVERLDHDVEGAVVERLARRRRGRNESLAQAALGEAAGAARGRARPTAAGSSRCDRRRARAAW